MGHQKWRIPDTSKILHFDPLAEIIGSPCGRHLLCQVELFRLPRRSARKSWQGLLPSPHPRLWWPFQPLQLTFHCPPDRWLEFTGNPQLHFSQKISTSSLADEKITPLCPCLLHSQRRKQEWAITVAGTKFRETAGGKNQKNSKKHSTKLYPAGLQK